MKRIIIGLLAFASASTFAQINILSATFGLNVGADYNNAISGVNKLCKNKTVCTLTIFRGLFPDPAYRYEKDFTV